MTIQQFRRIYSIKNSVLKLFLLKIVPQYKYNKNPKLPREVIDKIINDLKPPKKVVIIDSIGKRRNVDLTPLLSCQNVRRTKLIFRVQKEAFQVIKYRKEIYTPMGGQVNSSK